MTKNDGWIQTYTGKRFYPLDPNPDDIDIVDIAAALSKTCRFGGHTVVWYSVAEHCVHVARHAAPEYKLAALLHDASEAYLVDVPRPIKPLITNYYDIETKIEHAIAKKFGITFPLPEAVKLLDSRILSDERDQAMKPTDFSHTEWGNILVPLGVKLNFWGPGDASMRYLDAFERYNAMSTSSN